MCTVKTYGFEIKERHGKSCVIPGGLFHLHCSSVSDHYSEIRTASRFLEPAPPNSATVASFNMCGMQSFIEITAHVKAPLPPTPYGRWQSICMCYLTRPTCYTFSDTVATFNRNSHFTFKDINRTHS